MAGICEECINFVYDDDAETYLCYADFDEDEIYRLEQGCPYFRGGDDYELARKQ